MSNPKKDSSLSPTLKEIPGPVPHFDTVQGLRAGCFKMKDNTFYFPHDNTSCNDDKIIDLRSELGYEGYGIFWALLELLHQNDGIMQMNSKRLAFALQVDEQKLNSIINDYDLFVIEDGNFYSQRLLNHIEYRAGIVEKRKEAGSKGGKSKEKNITSKIPYSDTFYLETLGWSKNLSQFSGLRNTYPKLFLFTFPLKFEEHQKLLKKYTPESVEIIYNEMQNYKDLLKKSESAYLTATNWLNRKKK